MQIRQSSSEQNFSFLAIRLYETWSGSETCFHDLPAFWLRKAAPPVYVALSPTAMQRVAEEQEIPPSALSGPGASGLGTIDHVPAFPDSTSVLMPINDSVLPTAVQRAALIQATPPSWS